MTQVLEWLRTIAATIGAAVAAAVSIATGGARSNVTLERGDTAPDFSLTGSDGRTYRLRDLLGRSETIVIAWFPRAFTGG